MTYINNLLHIFSNYTLTNPVKILILFIIIILCFLIKCTYKYKIKAKYKIHNFTLNSLYIGIYVLYYIIIMLIIRYYAWGLSTDLKPFFNKIKNICIYNTLVACLFALIIIQLFLLLLKFRLFLLKEIKKRHLYESFHSVYKINADSKSIYDIHYTPIYNRIKTKIDLNYSFQTMIYKLRRYLHNINIVIKNLALTVFIIKLIPKLILISLFLYDCYFNNFVISKIYYYLPFYIIYSMWVQMTEFLSSTDNIINNMIYERYYEEENVLYVNIPDENDEAIFNSYLRNGLIFSGDSFRYQDPEKYYELKEIMLARNMTLKRLYKFYRQHDIKDSYLYTNDNLGLDINLTETEFLEFKNSKED